MKRMFLSLAIAATCLLSAGYAHSSDIRLCTGSSTGVYFDAGETIKSFAPKGITIQNIETSGTMDNMDMTINNECDAFIGQPDGPAYMTRKNPAMGKKFRQIGSLHREYLHVLCGKDSDVDDLGDLENDPSKYSIAVGDNGSGAWLIWQNLITEDEDYGNIPTVQEGGDLALSSVSSGTATCMLVPAGLGNGTVNEADGVYGDTIKLVGANDKDFNDALGIDGKPLYQYAEIDSYYKQNLQRGWGSDVDTLSWLAGVFVNVESFPDKKVLSSFIQAVARASVNIKATYGK